MLRNGYDLPLWITRDLESGVIDHLSYSRDMRVVILYYPNGTARAIPIAVAADYASQYHDSIEDTHDRWTWQFEPEMIEWFEGRRSSLVGIVARRHDAWSSGVLFSASYPIEFKNFRGVVYNSRA